MKLHILLLFLNVGYGIINTPLAMADPSREVCVGMPDNVMVIDPESCENYYICRDGIGVLAPCPGGDWFDPINQWCALPDNIECHLYITTTSAPVVPSRNPNVEDGIHCPATDNPLVMQFLPSLIDCERYYICYHGQPNPMRCLDGFYWNQAKQMCDYPIDANCALDPTPIGLICPRSTSSGKPSIVPHPTECELYYYCINGVPQVQQCPLLYHFDYQSQECMIRDRALCFRNRNDDTRA